MEMFQCPLCKAVFDDCPATLTHECPVLRIPTDDSEGIALERYRLKKIERERDKNERVGFAIQVHANYLFCLAKLVVPYEGRHARGSSVLDTRTIDEFMSSWMLAGLVPRHT